ncbi:MAG: hypothetical protein ACREAA_01915 [Candidatus Polarisedimenticolia bacterium]
MRRDVPGPPGWPRDFAWAVLAAVTGGLALRALCFHAYADGWDSCEYVWAVDGGYLPHSPYILYLWLGRLVSLVLPTDVGLSAVSLLSGIAAIGVSALLVRKQTGSSLAGGLAGAAYAVFPCAVWFSGIQEVYALAGALGLASMLAAWSAGTIPAAVAGALFGAALATHTGMFFLLPAFIVAVATQANPSMRWRRLATAGLAGMVVPMAAVIWVAAVLPGPDRGGPGLTAYLVGIAPIPSAPEGFGLLASLGRTLQGAAAETMRPGAPTLVLAACTALAWLRGARVAAFWLVYASPYLVYETVIGWNVDPGVHVVFAGPAFAAMLGCGVASLESWRPRILRGVTLAAVLMALIPAVLHSVQASGPVLSRASFLESEPVATLRALRSEAPPNAVVVQPPGVDNVNLVPAYAGRRPVILQEGRYLLFEGLPGSPLNLGSFSLLTSQTLERLMREGIPVLSLVPDPFPVGQVGMRWHPTGRIYALRRGD